jgi:hypothetical protein
VPRRSSIILQGLSGHRTVTHAAWCVTAEETARSSPHKGNGEKRGCSALNPEDSRAHRGEIAPRRQHLPSAQ